MQGTLNKKEFMNIVLNVQFLKIASRQTLEENVNFLYSINKNKNKEKENLGRGNHNPTNI